MAVLNDNKDPTIVQLLHNVQLNATIYYNPKTNQLSILLIPTIIVFSNDLWNGLNEKGSFTYWWIFNFVASMIPQAICVLEFVIFWTNFQRW